MRMLLPNPAEPGSLPELTSLYPWPEGTWVRAMMVCTLDGSVAGPDGRSGSISSPQDRAVLSAVRRYSDAVLIGAQTLRAERYNPMRAVEQAQPERASAKQQPAPVLVIVSRSLALPWGDAVFSESALRPIVVTAGEHPAQVLEAAQSASELVTLPGERVGAAALLQTLTERGLHRIVCEGGPRLLRDLAAAGLLDELDLSISPSMGGQTPAPSTAPLHQMRLHQMLLGDDGFLFTRYLRTTAGEVHP